MKEILRMIDRLSRLDTAGERVLSVYLSTDPSRGPGQNLRAHVRDVLHPLIENRDGRASDGVLADEIQAVDNLVEQLGDRPRGLAVFRSRALDLFEMLPLGVAPKPSANWARRANLRPLLSLLDEHEPTILLLVDKERARVFRWVLDTLEEVESFEDEVPGKHAQGGESQKNFQRHHDEHVLQHVRRAVEALERHANHPEVRRIAVGGPAEVLGHVRRHVPAALESRFAGILAVPVSASNAQILEAARAVRADWEREEERRIIADLHEHVGRGRAALGARDVVDAVVQQRAKTLVFADGARVPGGRCENCQLLFAHPAPERCPACGRDTEELEDLMDLLASRVLRQGGRIEEVRGAAAEELAADAGIGAELLYPAPA